ncbi:GLPGLI family protein, partial [Sphingobacterium mizutaii]|uniref:GLPGLI family protein n=1 Tax=Sphingobacterium mizutaii TaxID=1010 RepID=UPI0016263AB9
MKNTILLILLIIGIFIKSQTHRYIYELQFKYDSTEADRAKVNMVLDITPKEVKFYGEDLLVTDSINKKMGSQNIYFDMSGQIVKRKVNSFENENFISIKFNYYTYKTTDKISWNISGETKKEQGYTLQKATTKFGGRNWTAWFNKDIPFNEGPFKFRNLP